VDVKGAHGDGVPREPAIDLVLHVPARWLVDVTATRPARSPIGQIHLRRSESLMAQFPPINECIVCECIVCAMRGDSSYPGRCRFQALWQASARSLFLALTRAREVFAMGLSQSTTTP
jgi:hypothetical protein